MDIKSVTEKIQETVTAPTGAPGGVGVVISMPGTEKIVLDTSHIQLMEYESSEIPSRKRFALIEKPPAHGVHSLTHVVTVHTSLLVKCLFFDNYPAKCV